MIRREPAGEELRSRWTANWQSRLTAVLSKLVDQDLAGPPKSGNDVSGERYIAGPTIGRVFYYRRHAA